jgi:2-polyprenyl-6-methoxyphenol hydroxylase-like FAD-dependent oxidoreductase
MFMLLRSRVISALKNAALNDGVEIVTSSDVSDVTEAGSVLLANGSARKGDLVVVADGAGSRGSLRQAVAKSHSWYDDGSIRLLLPLRNQISWPAGTFVEYWSGRRRAMLVPCSEEHFYLGLIARRDDSAGIQIPLDIANWQQSFPLLAPFLEQLGEQERWSWDRYQSVILKRWHVGKVAFVGDAAHAMSPNFGQGAALAMVSALSLASILDQSADVETALARWEAIERPLIDRTQFLSGLYSRLMGWPDRPRSAILAMMGRSRWIMKQRTLAAYRTPVGYRPPGALTAQAR